MDIVIRNVSRILFPFILLLGAYIGFHGHLSPGGGFAGGVVMATGFALLLIAYTEGSVEHRLKKSEIVDIKSVAGVIVLILMVNVSILMRGGFLSSQTQLSLWSGGFTPILNVSCMFMVVSSIVIILYAMIKE